MQYFDKFETAWLLVQLLSKTQKDYVAVAARANARFPGHKGSIDKVRLQKIIFNVKASERPARLEAARQLLRDEGMSSD